MNNPNGNDNDQNFNPADAIIDSGPLNQSGGDQKVNAIPTDKDLRNSFISELNDFLRNWWKTNHICADGDEPGNKHCNAEQVRDAMGVGLMGATLDVAQSTGGIGGTNPIIGLAVTLDWLAQYTRDQARKAKNEGMLGALLGMGALLKGANDGLTDGMAGKPKNPDGQPGNPLEALINLFGGAGGPTNPVDDDDENGN